MRRLVSAIRAFAFSVLRRIFRSLPLTEKQREVAREAFIRFFPALLPPRQRGVIVNAITARRPTVRSDTHAIGHIAYRPAQDASPPTATLVAFYLPQFHPIPENDAWWGPGFTEWRNVTRAIPQFEGHAQPRLPSDLGFYDLRNPQVMRDQAKLAREYGVGAFCFYVYWFAGKTLLESPVEGWRNDTSIDFPYCVCWANENWSRRWDGRSEDVLIAQHHTEDDDLAFIAHFAQYLRDSRYLRVDGKPLLLVYRPSLLPDAIGTAKRWRDWCRSNGIGEIAIANVHSFDRSEPHRYGFDFSVEFPPNMFNPRELDASQRLINREYDGRVVDWRGLAHDYMQRPTAPDWLFPSVNCGWDNEPRRPGRGLTYLHAAPRRYEDWLRHTVDVRLQGRTGDRRLVFVNAWNEWAEGAVLEPDMRLGHAWLEATRRTVSTPKPLPRPTRPCVLVHAWYAEVLKEILEALADAHQPHRLIVTTCPERSEEIQRVIDRQGIKAELVVHENRGRDVLPFLHVADRLLNEGESLVLKLHTKRSPHREDGERWRHELLESLTSQFRWNAIMDAFAADSRLGLVAPEGHVQPMSCYWGANADNVGYLCTRIGVRPPEEHRDRFIAGTMFWARLDALRPLLDAHLSPDDFEREEGQLDGTLAHAIERLVALCAEDVGYRMTTAAALCGDPEPRVGADYPYAQRG